MPFCNQCGADVAGVRFCSKCGAAVEAEAAPRPPSASGAPPTAQASGGDISENVAAALAYIPPVNIIFLLIEPYKNRRFVRFHSFQSIFYMVGAVALSIALSVVGSILALAGLGMVGLLFYPLSMLVWLGSIVLWIILVIKAYQGQHFKVPVIGDFAEKQAG